jgi:hypothetical protein
MNELPPGVLLPPLSPAARSVLSGSAALVPGRPA